MIGLTSANVDVNINATLQVKSAIKNAKKIDNAINELFEIQRLIRNKNIRKAIALLDDLDKQNLGISIISELRGTALYLLGEYESSLANYREAFRTNSDNKDAYKMKVYLEDKLGIEGK